jgi:hypothetical protein
MLKGADVEGERIGRVHRAVPGIADVRYDMGGHSLGVL